LSSYESTMMPTYGTGQTTIRIPKGVQVAAVEVYVPAATAQRERSRQSAARLGVTRKDFDQDRTDWRRYRSLKDAESDGFIEVIPEQEGSGVDTGGLIVVLHGQIINIILS